MPSREDGSPSTPRGPVGLTCTSESASTCCSWNQVSLLWYFGKSSFWMATFPATQTQKTSGHEAEEVPQSTQDSLHDRCPLLTPLPSFQKTASGHVSSGRPLVGPGWGRSPFCSA